jgi:hypothetical protein
MQGDTLPLHDARFDKLRKTIIDKRLRDEGGKWKADEKLIIFTEYKTTLDYLERRLKSLLKGSPEAVKVLYGGMDKNLRDEIKLAFNDRNSPLKILVATDAASEGLNLQESSCLLLHYDIPWNPSRLEQRNGRLDRHGQSRDVTVFHFTSDDNSDLKFLSYVVGKVNTIKEDLGSMGEVFDAAFGKYFSGLEKVEIIEKEVDESVEEHRNKASIPEADNSSGQEFDIQAFSREIDLTPATLRDTLEMAMAFHSSLPRFEPINGKVRLHHPLAPQWESIINDTIRLKTPGQNHGSIPYLTFSPDNFIETINGRAVFRKSKDTVLMHLGHPLLRQTLAQFARLRYPGSLHGEMPVSRWSVKYGNIPEKCDALILMSVEELAVNELREPLHHWVRTLRIPVSKNKIGKPLEHVPPADEHSAEAASDAGSVEKARTLWLEVEHDLHTLLEGYRSSLLEKIGKNLDRSRKDGITAYSKASDERMKEIEKSMNENRVQKLEEQRRKILNEMMQGILFSEMRSEKDKALANVEEEIERNTVHFKALLEKLKYERTRMLEKTLPMRFALKGGVQVYPATIEFRFRKRTK